MSRVAEVPRGITPDELRSAISRADARAFPVSIRILRRVIRHEAKLGRFGLDFPHRKCHVLGADQARALLDPEELGLSRFDALPDRIILLIEPDAEKLASLSREQALQRYWRLLFHARIHLAIEERGLSDAEIAHRIGSIGLVEFEEIRAVLQEENFLLPKASDRSVYEEFASVVLELRHFAPHAIRAYFPSVRRLHAVEESLRHDIDDLAILAETNLEGVPLPPPSVHAEHEAEEFEPPEDDFAAVNGDASGSESRWRSLSERAEGALEVGNSVRSAILRTIAVPFAPVSERARTHASAYSALDGLVRRLRHALELTDVEATRWRQSLRPLLDKASQGLWPREARLLYDLQKIGIEREKEVYALDLVGWAATLGRRPFKRLLPHHREVLALKHLRTASWRLRKVRVSEADRQRIGLLIDRAIHHAEARLRERFRPIVAATLNRNDIVPRSRAEAVACRKLVEELVDKLVASGFLRFGDLRDTFSRNQVKFPDVAGVGEWFGGDRLLRVDSDLSHALDGVYHRGEIYIRALQRFSSLLFGTVVGRFLTCYVILPWGGAFVILEGLTHLVALFVHAFHGVEPKLLNRITWTIIALVIMACVNAKRFRQGLWHATKRVAGGIAFVLYDTPRWVFERRLVRECIDSRSFQAFWNWVVKPTLLALLIRAVWPFTTVGVLPARSSGTVGNFLAERPIILEVLGVAALSVLMNSRPGRILGEVFTDGFARLTRRLRVNFVAGLFRFIVDLFAAMVEAVERVLYEVDERLRFRSGEGRIGLIAKAIVGVFWFAVTYLVRIYVNLLIEPQINPIKHFPVVTVSHKIILPMTFQITQVVRVPFLPLGTIAANTIAVSTVFLLPGVFGFLVWEFKENWKLYEANRPKNLRPEMVGHHGETVRAYLRPGFHSGTIPKLFARWRKSERRAQRRGRPALARRPREALHHVEESLGRFVQRSILFLLESSPGFRKRPLSTGAVSLATNRISFEVRMLDQAEPVRITLEEFRGVLSGRVESVGWLDSLDEAPRRDFDNALAGFLKYGAVEHLSSGEPNDFKTVEISWNRWVAAWEVVEGRGGSTTPLVDGFQAVSSEESAFPSEMVVDRARE